MNYAFHHIHLLCSDLEATIAFFTESFGAKLVGRPKFGGADGASLDANGTVINLRVAAEGETVGADATQPAYGYHHICFKVDDVDAAYKELTKKKVKFLSGPTTTPTNLRVAFCKGPDGIPVEIMQLL